MGSEGRVSGIGSPDGAVERRVGPEEAGCGIHKQDTVGPREAPMMCLGVGVGSRKENPSPNYLATVSRT